METTGFRKAGSAEQRTITESEKHILGERIIILLVFAFLSVGVVILTEMQMSRTLKSFQKKAKETDYLEGFAETEETVIRELYGTAQEYAESMVYKNKSQFLDKQKTAQTGTMTYNEYEISQYREKMIAEFESRIDREKVEKVLAERKEEYRLAKKASTEDINKARKKNPARTGSFVIAAFVLVAEGVAAFFWVRRYRLVRDGFYEIADGCVTAKKVGYYREFPIRRKAEVCYSGGSVLVRMPLAQAMATKKGQEVYLIRIPSRFSSYLICKK